MGAAVHNNIARVRDRRNAFLLRPKARIVKILHHPFFYPAAFYLWLAVAAPAAAWQVGMRWVSIDVDAFIHKLFAQFGFAAGFAQKAAAFIRAAGVKAAVKLL